MGSSKQPSNTTSVTTTELPKWIQPYAESLLNKGVAASERPYEAYTGQRISPLAQEQEMGLQGTVQRATQGNRAVNMGENMLADTMSGRYFNMAQNPAMQMGQGALMNTLGGAYLTPESNPYLERNVNTAMSNVAGRLNSQFNRPGAYGSTAHQETMARSLGDVANQMYGQNYSAERQNQMGGINQALGYDSQDFNKYQAERGNQMNAAAQALGYGQADYQDLNALLAAGDTRRQYGQDVMNQQYQDWLEQQNYPLRQLDILGNTIGMSMGNTGSTTSTAPNPYRGSSAANLLGYGAGAAGLYSLLGS